MGQIGRPGGGDGTGPDAENARGSERFLQDLARSVPATAGCRSIAGGTALAKHVDQTISGNFDPGATGLPATATIVKVEIDDVDNDGVIRANGIDQINGSNVTKVWNGDSVTLNGEKITGVTFYTADGSCYFTPKDGSVLENGTITARTFVTKSSSFKIGDLGPPCFVAGTLIAVPGGQVAVEDLAPGDFVETRDHGPRPLRWVGRRAVAGRGAFAPVRLRAGALGNHGALDLSPQHRVLLDDWRAQVLAGEDEALCPAHLLVNGDTIHRAPRARVTYVHIMFDAHEIVQANGLACESFQFGGHLCQDGTALRAELVALFPDLEGPAADMQAARRSLRGHEARLLATLAQGDRSPGPRTGPMRGSMRSSLSGSLPGSLPGSMPSQ